MYIHTHSHMFVFIYMVYIVRWGIRLIQQSKRIGNRTSKKWTSFIRREIFCRHRWEKRHKKIKRKKKKKKEFQVEWKPLVSVFSRSLPHPLSHSIPSVAFPLFILQSFFLLVLPSSNHFHMPSGCLRKMVLKSPQRGWHDLPRSLGAHDQSPNTVI